MHTDRPQTACLTGWVAIRDYFTLWLERLELYYNRRFEDLDAKTTLALAAADKAVTKAEIATEKRFEGVNEFRGALSDQTAKLFPREEALSKFENMQKDITSIMTEIQRFREASSLSTGRTSQQEKSKQSQETKQAWLIPFIAVTGLSVINLILNIFHK